ncbi:TadE/TadG family type IV pilus assembly protein [Desulfovibrio oxyclinae]|jgi:Flp pilus assembly protein TadG|uniref:TadE/TadG family type IV pilus assembly protein n=1 Tax=Desulfovibrio oxyclinae TaxID=63560 RepID=UPI00036EDA51|nr:TadE family protein [Desulfovibrio oxyclinae]
MSGNSKRYNTRKGNSTVEFALAASLVLVPLLLFMVDAHRMYTLHTSLNRAAREGAVQASRGHDARQAVVDSLSSAGFDPSLLTMAVQTAAAGDFGEAVDVNLSYDASGQVVLPLQDIFSTLAEASATAKME